MRLIDADELKNVFEEHEDRRGDLDCDWRILIDNAPTVEPKTKLVANVTFNKEQMEELVEKAKADVLAQIEEKGEWIRSEETTEDLSGSFETYTRSTCSICNQANGWGEVPYCPWCGAKMETKP